MSRGLARFHAMLPGGVQLAISRIQYEYLSHLDRNGSMLLMNYGWADLDPGTKAIPLSDHDEPHRYAIQLYHHVVSAIDVREKDILEVGCGRGGGASFVMRYLHPRSLIGVDRTARAIRFCNQHYAIEGLSFARGRAESLPWADPSFDIVLSIESSHCYTSMAKFLGEACRVLKPGGYLLLADFWNKNQLAALSLQLEKTGWTLLEQENITANVLRALDLDNERKEKLIRQKVPRLLQNAIREFAGMKGTHATYGRMKRGDMEYLNFIFRKEKRGCPVLL